MQCNKQLILKRTLIKFGNPRLNWTLCESKAQSCDPVLTVCQNRTTSSAPEKRTEYETHDVDQRSPRELVSPGVSCRLRREQTRWVDGSASSHTRLSVTGLKYHTVVRGALWESLHLLLVLLAFFSNSAP